MADTPPTTPPPPVQPVTPAEVEPHLGIVEFIQAVNLDQTRQIALKSWMQRTLGQNVPFAHYTYHEWQVFYRQALEHR